MSHRDRKNSKRGTNSDIQIINNSIVETSPPPTSNFYFSPISQDDVSKIIASLRSKSSFGHDGMSTKFLKTLVPVLLRPLTLIINQSLTTGIFPDQLKIAKVLPIHKKMKLQQWTTIDQYLYYQLYQKFLKRQLYSII